MHDIEPYFRWRDYYVASEDEASPFYGRVYSEFQYSQKIYNYFIHPQWDSFGSSTLYLKILFVDYHEGFAVIELIGEWNDCLYNDIGLLKRSLIDHLLDQEIRKFVLVGENVLNFHGGEEDYYEEWYEDVIEEQGWITLLNLQEHVMQEMQEAKLQHYLHLGPFLNDINWRILKPKLLLKVIETSLDQATRQLTY